MNVAERSILDRSFLKGRSTGYADLCNFDNSILFTIVLNSGGISFDQSRPWAKRFFQNIDELIFGKRYYKKPVRDRCMGFLVPEDFHWNPHFHGMIGFNSNSENGCIDLSMTLSVITEVFYPKADLHICSDYKLYTWAAYSSKGTSLSDIGSYWAFDFWPTK